MASSKAAVAVAGLFAPVTLVVADVDGDNAVAFGPEVSESSARAKRRFFVSMATVSGIVVVNSGVCHCYMGNFVYIIASSDYIVYCRLTRVNL